MSQAIVTMQETFVTLVKGKVPGGARAKLPAKAREDISGGEVESKGDDVTATIDADPWTLMINYGRGSLMDTNNPGLADYRASGQWSPYRSDLAIRSRVRPYTNIFGETVMPIRRWYMPGVNLERFSDNPAKYAPWAPEHFIESAREEFMQFEAQVILHNALNAIPWDMAITTPKK